MSEELFDRIRAACARVAERAEWVRIDPEGLERFAERLVRHPPETGLDDPARRAFADPARALAYVVTLDAINFGSGWFPELRKPAGASGYFTIADALKTHFEGCGPWSAEELRALRPSDCARVFGQEDNVGVADLMALFASALSDLGRLLSEHHAGRFELLVASAEGSAARLVRVLCRMPLYRDVAWHGGRPVPFYKRAQITAADLAGAFGGEGPGRFDDLDRLTLFADNLVPHVLRREGVLVCAAELASRIEAGVLLRPGSPEEVELRAVALHAVEELVAAASQGGLDLPAHALDHWLWSRGQDPRIKAHPRHRARSVYY